MSKEILSVQTFLSCQEGEVVFSKTAQGALTVLQDWIMQKDDGYPAELFSKGEVLARWDGLEIPLDEKVPVKPLGRELILWWLH